MYNRSAVRCKLAHAQLQNHVTSPPSIVGNYYRFLLTKPFQKSKLFSSLCSVHVLPVPLPSASVSSTSSMPQSLVMPSTLAPTPPSASSEMACPVCSQWR